MKTTFFVALLLCCSSCASRKLVWSKPGATEAEFRQTLKEAEFYSVAYTPDSVYVPNSNPFMSDAQRMGDAIGAGMASGMSEALRKNELIKRYMEMKGWTLVKTGRQYSKDELRFLMPAQTQSSPEISDDGKELNPKAASIIEKQKKKMDEDYNRLFPK